MQRVVFVRKTRLLENIRAPFESEMAEHARASIKTDIDREFRRGKRRRGWGSILHGQRTISMHEAHWSYGFLSTQNTYLHFGLCTGVSLLVFHVRLSLSSRVSQPFFSISLCFSLDVSLSLLSVCPFVSCFHCLAFWISRLLFYHLCRNPLLVLLSASCSLYPFLSLARSSVFLYSCAAFLTGVSTLTQLHTGRPTDPLTSC